MPQSKKAKIVNVNKKSSASTISAPKSVSLKDGQNLQNRQIKIGIAVVVLAAIIFFAKGVFVAALVNGKPISRLSVVSQLEKQGGKQTLDGLITKQLILDEAQKKNISLSQKEVDDQINTIQKGIEKQGSNLDQALASQGMTRGDLEDQIKIQLIVGKLIGNVTVSDKEVDDYIAKNKDQLTSGDVDANLRNQVKQQLIQTAKNQKTQDLIQTLRKEANITYFVNY